MGSFQGEIIEVWKENGKLSILAFVFLLLQEAIHVNSKPHNSAKIIKIHTNEVVGDSSTSQRMKLDLMPPHQFFLVDG